MTDNYDKVSLLLPMNGANNGTVFTDWSPVPKVVTATGGTITKTDRFKYYDSSAFFDGTNDWLDVPQLLPATAGDFYIGAWVYNEGTDATRTVFSQRERTDANNNGRFTFGIVADNRVLAFLGHTSGSLVLYSTNTLSKNAWNYIAVSRESNTFRVFINSALEGTDTNTQSVEAAPTAVGVGTFDEFGAGFGGFWHGNMQDVRVIVGAAEYTAAHTPPTRLIGTISNADSSAAKITDINGDPAERTVIAVPRSAPTRVFSDVSNASGEFEIQAPSGVDHSVVALADETSLYNDIVHRVIPE